MWTTTSRTPRGEIMSVGRGTVTLVRLRTLIYCLYVLNPRAYCFGVIHFVVLLIYVVESLSVSPNHIRLLGFARSCFENVVSSQGHMINVSFFSAVRSACLFILKSLRCAVFRS